MTEFFHKNAWAIMLIVGGAVLNGAIFYLNSIHAKKGEAETKLMRYEIRKMEAYEISDPGSKYSPARQMLIKELKDDLSEITE